MNNYLEQIDRLRKEGRELDNFGNQCRMACKLDILEYEITKRIESFEELADFTFEMAQKATTKEEAKHLGNQEQIFRMELKTLKDLLRHFKDTEPTIRTMEDRLKEIRELLDNETKDN